jgi:rhodanese-related sulfurtransferase
MKHIETLTLHQLIQENPNLVVIDVRSPEEYRLAHVAQAISMPLDTLMAYPTESVDQIKEWAGTQETIYVICLSDRRSFMACHKLSEHNVKNTCFIKGGTQGWITAGYSIVSGL